MTNFLITQEEIQGSTKLTLQGRIDSIDAAELGRKLDTVIQSGRTNIVLNMARVEFLGSTGIRAILKAYKNTKEAGGKLGIETPSECVVNVLGMAALGDMLME